jgi:hypothetical protein
MTDELPFKVVRSNGTDQVLAPRRQSAFGASVRVLFPFVLAPP